MFIEYTFSMDDGKVFHYEFIRDRDHVLETDKYPTWTLLEFHQCPNCPLKKAEYSHCPVAVDVHKIVFSFAEVLSCKEADIYVRTPEREYFKRTDAQTGLRSLIGFVMATSDCPIFKSLRGLAYYHLPFASLDETIFRATTAYLLQQYYINKKGGKIDLELNGLKKQFKELQTLNLHFLERIRAASDSDANLNVLATLFTICSIISLSLEKNLNEIEHLFE